MTLSSGGIYFLELLARQPRISCSRVWILQLVQWKPLKSCKPGKGDFFSPTKMTPVN